jgi:hypothetical protein
MSRAPILDKDGRLAFHENEESGVRLSLVSENDKLPLFDWDLHPIRIESLANNQILRARLH